MNAIALEMIRSDVKSNKAALAEVESSLECIGMEYCRLTMRKDQLLKEQEKLMELGRKIESGLEGGE